MTFIFSVLGRLIIISFALFVALLAGSFFIGFGLASGMFPELVNADGTTVFGDIRTNRTVLTAISFVFGLIASIQLIGTALLPITIAVAVLEMMKWQSLATQMILGGFCALFTLLSALSWPNEQMPGNGTLIVCLATGFVSTFFYWLIAGRNSGNWLSALGE